ncbi:hypothetical protein QA646_10700 [Rhizobium sp. CB3090]|nr:hypothetical protein [Rhizobium sp. CB3090]WFU07790.1 hypothetical protein QA646_10700 [Rhizobium sp. CB3090]
MSIEAFNVIKAVQPIEKGGPEMITFVWRNRQFGPNQALQMRLQG